MGTDSMTAVDADSAGRGLGAEALFATLYGAFKTMFGDVGLDGFTVSRDGTFHYVAGFGRRCGLAAMGGPHNTIRRLEGQLPQGCLTIEIDSELTLVLQKFGSDERPAGGFLLSGARLGSTDCEALRSIVMLAEHVLEMEQQTAVALMIVDALDTSDEAIAVYDTCDRIVFTNGAYHALFSHYPSQADIIGMSHIDLYSLDLRAGIIDDTAARDSPIAYLLKRIELNETLQRPQREVQMLKGRTFVYDRARTKSGASISRRTEITDVLPDTSGAKRGRRWTDSAS